MGGKTWAILLDNLLGVHDPDYLSVFFRSTNNELETNLWPAAKKMYHEFLFRDVECKQPIGKAHINEQTKTITFPSGAQSKFSYMQYDKDADRWYGSELCKVYIDELQMHSEYAFTVLRSRNRSVAKVPKGMRFTLNPDPNHWMFEWIEPFLLTDGSGLPNTEYAGKVRYFIIIDGKLISSWDKEELIDLHGKNPQTYTYIPATLKDNTVLQELDPEYYDVLDAMPTEKRNALLLGAWLDSADSGVYWKREWLKQAHILPPNITQTVRAYDLAGSIPTPNYRSPDYTVSIKMSKCSEGNYYMTGDYVPSFTDEGTKILGRMRRTYSDRDEIILEQAQHDGADIHLVLPEDTASAGKEVFASKVEYFLKHGFIVKKDVAVSNHKKLTKAEPFFQACGIGKVFILENTFTPETLAWLYGELERFVGERSGNSSTSKDDAVDMCATAYNYLARTKTVTLPNFTKIKSKTMAASLLSGL